MEEQGLCCTGRRALKRLEGCDMLAGIPGKRLSTILHFSYHFIFFLLLALDLCFVLVLLQAGVSLADDPLDCSKLARLLLYTHGRQ